MKAIISYKAFVDAAQLRDAMIARLMHIEREISRPRSLVKPVNKLNPTFNRSTHIKVRGSHTIQ